MTPTKLASISLAAALAITLTIAPAHAQAPRTFVSAAGSDSNNCTNVATPCRHFAAAFAATAPSGEIFALDPANYGSLTITHAVSIEGHGWASIAPPNGGNAITINAGPTDSISIHGVAINGTGATGTTNGIFFNAGGSLTVTDCVVENFSNDGIDFFPATVSSLSVSDTTAANNGRNGIFVAPFNSSGVVESVFSRVQVSSNADTGLVLDGAGSTGTLKGTVYESVAAKNGGNGAGNGYFSFTISGKAPTTLMIFHSVSANNTQGIFAGGPGATLRLANSMITGNVGSWGVNAGGVLQSYADNYIDGNGDGDPTPPTTARK